MTKSISAGLRTHLDGIVTNLCTVWKITRVDGTIFYFTDHDVDIVWDDGAGTATYLAETGYNRTAVANAVGLNVDNMDVEGVFDDDSITEEDLRAGRFDFADIEVSVLNWNDLTQDALKIRKGSFGEAMITPQGVFRCELRGLAQPLVQNLVDAYQADCRTDLGSTQCTIPILPDLIIRSTVYAVGDEVRVPTLAAGRTWSHLVSNPSFEQDAVATEVTTLIGWTVTSGTWDIVTGSSDARDQHLDAGGTDGVITQTNDLTKLLTTAEITSLDAGNATMNMAIARGNSGANTDTGRMIVQFLDSTAAPISTMWDSTATSYGSGGWSDETSGNIAVPATTRSVVTTFTTAGGNGEVKLDDVVLSYTDSTLTSTYSEVYENVYYECTTAGISALAQGTYDTVVGNTTDEEGLAATADFNIGTHSGILDGETVVINGTTYTAKTTIGAPANQVLIDVDAQNFLDNLVNAVNGGAGSGTKYSAATSTHTTVTGALSTTGAFGWQCTFSAIVLGPAGEAYTTSETLSGNNNKWFDADTPNFTDGTDGAIWTTRDAWTRDAHIYDVLSEREFEIIVSEARSVDDWFNYGGIIFETGDNIGLVHEVRDYTNTNAVLNIFMDTPFTLVPGTKISIYPGCDKRIETCETVYANAINFRGEPYVPGPDEVSKYPDAH